MARLSLSRLPLARQLLVLQLMIVVVVVAAVAAVSFTQTSREYDRSAGARTLALAETAATDRLVRAGLGSPANPDVVAPAATQLQTISGVDYVVVTDADGVVVAAQDPRRLGAPWPLFTEVRDGRAVSGESRLAGQDGIESQVPILDPDTAAVLGYAVVGTASPGVVEQLREGSAHLLLFLGIATVLGVAGSGLLARRIKKQTLGLEPGEITGLVENREALLHNIREGVVGLDPDGRITLANDEARRLLDLPVDAAGRTPRELGLDDVLTATLGRTDPFTDLVLSTDGRLLSISLVPVSTAGHAVGTVVTLRDRTELAGIRRELDVTRRTADSLRAQAHEFTNRLHTIAGLLHTRNVDHAVAYINDISAVQKRLTATVTSQIEDPTLAALLIAKMSVASEAGVTLVLAPESALDRVPIDVAADLETIIGNFLDNALDAVRDRPDPQVALLLRHHGGRIEVQVSDSGPGIATDDLPRLFERGFSTKHAPVGAATAAEAGQRQRGIGLALAHLVTDRRGGEVTAANRADDSTRPGAVFLAWFPYQSDHNEQ